MTLVSAVCANAAAPLFLRGEAMKRFAAEVLFPDPNDVANASAALTAAGCELTLDPAAIDPDSDTVFGMVVGTTELDLNALGDWNDGIITPYGGDLIQWNYGAPWLP